MHRAGKRTEERNQDQEIRRKQYKKGEIAEPRKLTKEKLRMFKLKIGKKINGNDTQNNSRKPTHPAVEAKSKNETTDTVCKCHSCIQNKCGVRQTQQGQ